MSTGTTSFGPMYPTIPHMGVTVLVASPLAKHRIVLVSETTTVVARRRAL